MSIFRVVWDDNANPIADNKAKEYVKSEIETYSFMKDFNTGFVEYEHNTNSGWKFIGTEPAPDWAKNIKPYIHKYEFRVCNNSVINEIRIAVLNEKLKPEEVLFIFNDEEITIDENLQLSKWPVGFCDLLAKQMTQIIRRKKDE